MIAAGRHARAAAVDDVGVRNTVKDRLKFSTKRFRVFKALVGEEVIAARTVEAARNVSRFRIVVFGFARLAGVGARVDERVVAKLQIAFHEVVVKDALQRHGGAKCLCQSHYHQAGYPDCR